MTAKRGSVFHMKNPKEISDKNQVPGLFQTNNQSAARATYGAGVFVVLSVKNVILTM